MISDLPRAVTSFGAAVANDTWYLYGGHFGQAHHYYEEGQSGELWRYRPMDDEQWHVELTGPRLQGLSLVAVGNRLLRIGGFEARNTRDEEQDLWSLPDTAWWDTTSRDEPRTWNAAASLGEARSSFDADVSEGRVYVVGGWKLQGGRDAEWCRTAEVGLWDEAAQHFTWSKISDPPFQRRALAVACCGGKVFAIGGMLPDGKVSRATSIYDPKQDRWTDGPELPGGDMAGFGAAALAWKGAVYVSTSEGQLLRLDPDVGNWEPCRKLQSARFFHQVLPLADDKLALVGGANMETGKFKNIEVVSLSD